MWLFLASAFPLFRTLQFDDYHLATSLKSGVFHTGTSSVGDDGNDSRFDANRFVRALESPPRIIRHADLLPFVFQLIQFCESLTQDLILRSLNYLVTGNDHPHEFVNHRRTHTSTSSNHDHNGAGKRPSSSASLAISTLIRIVHFSRQQHVTFTVSINTSTNTHF